MSTVVAFEQDYRVGSRRWALHLTQLQLAELAGVDERDVKNLESRWFGHLCTPIARRKVARALMRAEEMVLARAARIMHRRHG